MGAQVKVWRRGEDPFAGFTDVHEIGHGAFATVYRAIDATTDQPVAIKVLYAADTRRFDDRVLQMEARALGAVTTHPHIVTLHRAVLRSDGHPMLVLELCESSFADRLAATGPLTVREAVAVSVKLAGALETAHRAGVLHRDLKPSNVLTTAFGEPVLADFGIAGLREATSGGSMMSGLTVHHASPEVLLGALATPASDVYGLASVLYELLDGNPPFFVTRDEDPATVQRRIIGDPPPRLQAPDTSPALRDLLRRAMAKDPAERPSSALEFAQELREIERARGWALTPCRVEGLRDLPPLAPAARTATPGVAAATTGLPFLGLTAGPLTGVAPAERDLEPPRERGPVVLPGRQAPLLPARPYPDGDDQATDDGDDLPEPTDPPAPTDAPPPDGPAVDLPPPPTDREP